MCVRVQEIRDKRISIDGGKMEYLVHWEGYGTEEDTWEPKANLACSAMVGDFERISDTSASTINALLHNHQCFYP